MARGLDVAHKNLGWPKRRDILDPPGSGPSIYAGLVQKKLLPPIARLVAGGRLDVGVLTRNPEGQATETPLAVVCDFATPASDRALRLAHRLAWNFCHSPLLITLEPHVLRAWTCCRAPKKGAGRPDHAEIKEAQVDLRSISAQAARALDWLELISGETFRRHDGYFRDTGRADQALLNNLRFARKRLLEDNLQEDVCHDLLARVIFTQFLFHRKDSRGKSALNPMKLRKLHGQGVLSMEYPDLQSILRNHRDTYNLFRWLNSRFNGDLFPGKGETHAEREAEWREEMHRVTSRHLHLLAELVSGQTEMEKGQRCLWPEYAFDAIPLEFISSVYEEFVHKPKPKKPRRREHTNGQEECGSEESGKGIHYTPQYLVDFILDAALPWNGKEWQVKILDPACGSGIFLVKAFQRLVHRWKAAHKDPREAVDAALLRNLLETCLFGVDIDRAAVRVASFSLYLAMCDEIDPKHYWTQVKFPRLRGNRLVQADFFREDGPGFRTDEDASTYDLVVGNAPWGKGSDTPEARQRAARDPDDRWPISGHNIGPLFLPKAAALTRPQGRIAMFQPASALLFNRESTAMQFREKFFSRYKVEGVTNLSALRFGLFKNAISPSCIVSFRPTPPDGEPLAYICPKPRCTREDDYGITIEPQDINHVFPDEASQEPWVWSALAWGGRRDLALVRRLNRSRNLEYLATSGEIAVREGVIRGDRKKKQEEILGQRILEAPDFPEGTFLHLNAAALPINSDPRTGSRASTNLSAFRLPQLLVKQTRRARGRFRSVMVLPGAEKKGVICSQSYLSVHVPPQFTCDLESACLTYNSKLAVYFLLLTSGRFAFYIPEPLVQELLRVPIPEPQPGLLDGIEGLPDVDARTREAFGFNDAEWTLVEDLFDYTLPDFKRKRRSPGRKPTRERASGLAATETESHLRSYCQFFIRVLKAAFGQDKNVSATIFQRQSGPPLPVRLVAIHLDCPGRKGVEVKPLESGDLRSRLLELHRKFLRRENRSSRRVAFERVARVYDTMTVSGRSVPTVYLIKPDQIRYWTRSMALRDADEVAADILLWREGSRSGPRVRQGGQRG